jgi:hypothetical protein
MRSQNCSCIIMHCGQSKKTRMESDLILLTDVDKHPNLKKKRKEPYKIRKDHTRIVRIILCKNRTQIIVPKTADQLCIKNFSRSKALDQIILKTYYCAILPFGLQFFHPHLHDSIHTWGPQTSFVFCNGLVSSFSLICNSKLVRHLLSADHNFCNGSAL